MHVVLAVNRYRRLKMRYEWRADIYHLSFLDLGCVWISYSFVRRLR